MKSLLFSTCLAALLTLTSLNASAQAPTTPIEFNDHLVAITDSLYQLGRDWGAKFNEVNQSKKYSELATTRKGLESFIKRKQVEIQKLKNINGSEELKKAHLNFLAYEFSLIKDAFMPLEKLTAQSTDAEIKKLLDNLRAISMEESKKLQEVNAAQRAYAEKNGFTIESGEEEEE